MNPKPPQDRLFYKAWGHLLAYAGLGSDLWWWYQYPKNIILYYMFKLQAFCVVYIFAVSSISQMAFLYLNFNELSVRTRHNVYSIIPIALLLNVKVISAKRGAYRKVIKDFMDKIHLYNYYQDNHTEFVRMKLMQIEKISLSMGLGLFMSFYSSWLTWMITPFVLNSRNMEAILNRTENFFTCTYLWMPFEYIYDYNKWFIANACNAYITFMAVLIIVSFDAANYIIIIHLISHIQILKHNIKISFVTGVKYSDSETKTILTRLIQHHCFIMEVFKDLQAAFGLNLAANYMQNFVEDGLLMYQLMRGDKESFFTYGLTLLVSIAELILMSLVLEEIQRKSEDLPEILYTYVPWQDMCLSNQKTFTIMMATTQQIMEFRGIGGFRAGMLPAFNILKTTFSYYVMIKSRQSGE